MGQNNEQYKPILLSIPKAASLLGVDRSTVEDMLNDPQLGRILIGKSRQVRILRPDLMNYINHLSQDWFNRN